MEQDELIGKLLVEADEACDDRTNGLWSRDDMGCLIKRLAVDLRRTQERCEELEQYRDHSNQRLRRNLQLV